MRARMALWISNQVCELREVVLRQKPAELLALSAKGTVPVLVDPKGQVYQESLDIMLWALERHDPQGWLQPEAGTLAALLAWIEPWDHQFKFHLDRYKYAYRYEGVEAVTHRGEASTYLDQLNSQLQDSPYLFGNRICLADVAIAPFIRQFSQVDLTWFNSQPWLQVNAWLASILESTLFTQTMEKYPQWKSGTPGSLFPPSKA
ncbi:MAG: glutathione S-transferase [Acaryochloridaceae cyanobacterium SU_2_1]|nr:glutathione S-transferase [Acaryochloridaceae cyanobacterium SU_2_1]NJM95181.1 glutathione S-transferase [Acaryochloridaceae cyanobacterium CSU_5_19]